MRLKTHMSGLFAAIGLIAGILMAGGAHAQVAAGDCKKIDGTSGVIIHCPTT